MTTKTLTGAYPSGYYLKPAYAALTIAAGAYVGGAGVTTSASQPSSITNFATVDGTSVGISLADGGQITNGGAGGAGALIEGTTAILAKGGPATVTNAATIQSTTVTIDAYKTYTGPSIALEAGGKITNTSPSALISNGVKISGGAGTVINRGVIGGAAYEYRRQGQIYLYSNEIIHTAIEMTNGGFVSNGPNGDTTAEIRAGIYITGGAGSVVNQGVIYGPSSDSVSPTGNYASFGFSTGLAVGLGDGGTVINGSPANASAKILSQVYIGGGPGTVFNFGEIVGGYSGYSEGRYRGFRYLAPGVSLQSGMVVNGSASDTTALIQCVAGGVITLSNFGSINGARSIDGVDIGGGEVTNGSAADHGASIRSTLIAVDLRGVGSVINYGTISAAPLSPRLVLGLYGIQLSGGGNVVNGSSVDTAALIYGHTGVELAGPGTVTNFAILSASGPAENAVSFASSGDVLIEEASGVLIGKVAGGGGALELAPAMGTGTIAGIGRIFNGFSLIDVEAGAGWHFTGQNTIAAGTTLTNAAAIVDDGVLTNNGTVSLGALLQLTTNASVTNAAAGQITLLGNVGIAAATGATGTRIVNAGTLTKSGGTGVSNLIANISNTGAIIAGVGTLNVGGAVTGAGAWTVDGGATLEFRFAVASSATVAFAGAGADLELTDTVGFAGKVSAFAAGETIDLRQIGFGTHTALSYSGSATSGTLTVSNGAHVAKVALLGQYLAANFHLASDGQGGTDVTFVATPSAAALAVPAGH